MNVSIRIAGVLIDVLLHSIFFSKRLLHQHILDHDILWDLGFPTQWEDPIVRQELLYNNQTDLQSWYEWRDLRVMGKFLLISCYLCGCTELGNHFSLMIF